VTLANGERASGRKLLLATGLVDKLPELPGLRELYGKSAFHCPYCDGWEVRDKPIAVYGEGCEGFKLAMTLRIWTQDVVLLTNGSADFDKKDKETLARMKIVVRSERVARLEGADGILQRVVFEGGESVARSALFLKMVQVQGSDLARKLRLPVSEEDGIKKGGKYEETYIKGVFVAGDASKDLLLAIVAAAEGAQAAFGMNCELQEEDQRA
jgi:thioredoxin reductase